MTNEKLNLLKSLKKQLKNKEQIDKANNASRNDYIQQQMDAEKANELNSKKQLAEKEKQEVIQEGKMLCRNIFNLLKRCGLVSSKQSFSSEFLQKTPSYWGVIDNSNQPISVSSLKSMKDQLYEYKFSLKYILKEEDEMFSNWAFNKFEGYIEQIERLISKILRLYYGIY